MKVLSGKTTAQKYLTTQQLAEKFGLHRSTIWRWKFPAHNRAGDKRFELAECEAYLDSAELKTIRKQLNDESRARSKMLFKLKSKFDHAG
jgi:transposase-like protein